MPWKESRAMDLRVRLVKDYEEGESITSLSEFYGISRKTIYKRIHRWEQLGTAGLAEQSRAPHHRPQTTSAEITKEVIRARQRWKWGPRKLLVKLQQMWPQQEWPSASTIGDILQRAGLVTARRKRLRTPLYARPFAAVRQANQTWCADFKGWFRTRDGIRCDPLTITDAYSRYL